MPVILWVSFVGFNSLTTSTSIFVASIGKATALSGMALYVLLPVLSMRHRLLELVFGGLDRLYILHSKAGKISFFLILLHPICLGAGRLIGGKQITTIWDWWSLLILTGVFAFVILSFVAIMAVYSHIKHQKWIWIHRIFGWLIILFFAHALLANNQIMKNELLFAYILTLSLIGFSAFIYRSVLFKYFVVRYRYELAEINHMSEKVSEFVLKPTGVPISYNAGQFAFVSFESPTIDTEAHPYSFSNANNGPYVRFIIKALGDDTTKLQKIDMGATVYLEGPFGQFSYKNIKNRKQVWIAGGIGITPFLSMARSFSGKKQYDIRFYYATESLDDAVFLQEFIDITRHIPENFKTTVVSKNISGFISTELLQKSIDNLKDYDFLICGPPQMMSAICSQLKTAGISSDNIHVESLAM